MREGLQAVAVAVAVGFWLMKWDVCALSSFFVFSFFPPSPSQLHRFRSLFSFSLLFVLCCLLFLFSLLSSQFSFLFPPFFFFSFVRSSRHRLIFSSFCSYALLNLKLIRFLSVSFCFFLFLTFPSSSSSSSSYNAIR